MFGGDNVSVKGEGGREGGSEGRRAREGERGKESEGRRAREGERGKESEGRRERKESEVFSYITKNKFNFNRSGYVCHVCTEGNYKVQSTMYNKNNSICIAYAYIYLFI